MKRILAIHDLSGFGHTSLMAVIPLMNRLGIRVCSLPTTVLSANTDYPGYVGVDMSPQLDSFAAHWKELELTFNAISSGFLAGSAQASQIKRLIRMLRQTQTFVLVDPVMGDQGKLYKCFDQDIIPAMRDLIGEADLVTPNYTEAVFLAGIEAREHPGQVEVAALCRAVSALGPRHVVITSVPTQDTSFLEVHYYDADTEQTSALPFIRREGLFPGAGDCFSALLLAGIINGHKVENSALAAVSIMSRATGLEPEAGTDAREGLPLELVLQWDLPGFYN